MGGNESKATNWVENTVKASINVVMDSTIESDVTVACKNVQMVENARDCNIQFADQICKAVGISNFTGNQEMTADVAQDVMNQVTADASAVMDGLLIGVKNSSEASNTVKNNTELVQNIAQSFMTSCTRDVSAVNSQSVKNCWGGTIKFAPQDVSGEVIGDCVANQVGKLTAAQSVTNIVDVAASSVMKGIDPFATLMMIAGLVLLFIFGVPMFIGAMKKALAKKADSDPTAKTRMMGILVLFVVWGLFLGIWWPGYLSMKMGVFPHSFPGIISDEYHSPICKQGVNMKRDIYINEFMWWDPFCLSTPGKPCNDTNRSKHYKGCGLFATRNGCTDPLFKQQKAKYIEVTKECAKIAGTSYKFCDSRNIQAEVFPTKDKPWNECEKCIGDDNYGLYIQTGQDCKKLSQYHYRRNGPCDPNDEMCRDNHDDQEKHSPGECKAIAYHDAKKIYSKHLRVCDKLDGGLAAVTTNTNGGEKPTLEQQCPPWAFDYFTKCNAETMKCAYIPTGCTGCDENGVCKDCSGVDPRSIAACHNDYDGCCRTNDKGQRTCNDEDYATDLDVYDYWNDTCKQRWELHEKLNPIAWQATLGVYVAILLLIIILLIKTPGLTSNMMGPNGSFRETASGSKMQIALFIGLILINMVAGFPFGILGLVYEGEAYSFHDKGSTKKINAWNQKTATIVGWSVFGLTIVLMLAQIGFALKKKATIIVAAP